MHIIRIRKCFKTTMGLCAAIVLPELMHILPCFQICFASEVASPDVVTEILAMICLYVKLTSKPSIQWGFSTKQSERHIFLFLARCLPPSTSKLLSSQGKTVRVFWERFILESPVRPYTTRCASQRPGDELCNLSIGILLNLGLSTQDKGPEWW